MNPLYEEFKKLLESEQKEQCVNWALTHLKENKFTVVKLYSEILTPALNSITNPEDDIFTSIWKEHVKTSIVRTIIENSYPFALKERDTTCKGKLDQKVLVICPPDEYHEIGARMVADFFTIAGYTVIFIGANTPLEAFLSALTIEKPVITAISVSNPYHLFSTKKIIERIREKQISGMKIVVGGHAFANNPEAYKTIGADIQIQTFKELCELRGLN